MVLERQLKQKEFELSLRDQQIQQQYLLNYQNPLATDVNTAIQAAQLLQLQQTTQQQQLIQAQIAKMQQMQNSTQQNYHESNQNQKSAYF